MTKTSEQWQLQNSHAVGRTKVSVCAFGFQNLSKEIRSITFSKDAYVFDSGFQSMVLQRFKFQVFSKYSWQNRRKGPVVESGGMACHRRGEIIRGKERMKEEGHADKSLIKGERKIA